MPQSFMSLPILRNRSSATRSRLSVALLFFCSGSILLSFSVCVFFSSVSTFPYVSALLVFLFLFFSF